LVPRFNLLAAIETIMDDRAEVIPDFAASLTQITSDATRRVYEQGQTVTQTMSEWNTEVSHFLSRRVARNGETIGRITKCQNLPEVFGLQAQWVQEAADD
jgi:DNA anti-recombination protein RmuC